MSMYAHIRRMQREYVMHGSLFYKFDFTKQKLHFKVKKNDKKT